MGRLGKRDGEIEIGEWVREGRLRLGTGWRGDEIEIGVGEEERGVE